MGVALYCVKRNLIIPKFIMYKIMLDGPLIRDVFARKIVYLIKDKKKKFNSYLWNSILTKDYYDYDYGKSLHDNFLLDLAIYFIRVLYEYPPKELWNSLTHDNKYELKRDFEIDPNHYNESFKKHMKPINEEATDESYEEFLTKKFDKILDNHDLKAAYDLNWKEYPKFLKYLIDTDAGGIYDFLTTGNWHEWMEMFDQDPNGDTTLVACAMYCIKRNFIIPKFIMIQIADTIYSNVLKLFASELCKFLIKNKTINRKVWDSILYSSYDNPCERTAGYIADFFIDTLNKMPPSEAWDVLSEKTKKQYEEELKIKKIGIEPFNESFENRMKRILNEAPIGELQLKGEWEKGSKARGYDKASRGILTSDMGVQKIKTLWNKLPEVVDMYFVSSKHGWKHTEVGQVPYEFLRDKLHLDIPIDSDHITIVYTNNKGAEKVPTTGWTLAHRFGHALRRMKGYNINPSYEDVQKSVDELVDYIGLNLYNKKQVTKDAYNFSYNSGEDLSKIRKAICHALGTFRSARERLLRNSYEFTNELVAEYIVTGKITFNKQYPRILATRYTWGHAQGAYKRPLSEEDMQEVMEYVSYKEEEIQSLLQVLIENSVGNVYVM
jgi:hypothetical protein